jgi:threonine/homoserine/homoserine lactone efflux protein
VPDPSRLALFALASLLLAVVPGPAVLYIVGQAVHRGRLAGLVSTLGIGTGGLVHASAAALGLSSLLLSSATAFSVVKYAGAAYLIFLGLRTLLRRADEGPLAAREESTLRRIYRQGVVVNVLNPKTALFFLAFLPQFVEVDAGHVWLQLLALGGLFVAIAMCSDALYALAAGTAGELLRRSPRFLGVQRWVSGSVFVGLGVVTALSGAHGSSK